MVNIGLLLILVMVLSLPFLVKKIEEELEIFLFFMGCAAVTITTQWGGGLLREAIIVPINLTVAVLIAGFIFRILQRPIAGHVNKVIHKIGLKAFVFIVIAGLGLLSSIITAIIASLVLVEVVHSLNIEREIKVKVVILTCFSIGLGAALTAIGEPLGTITIAKLKGLPYQAGFYFLVEHLGWYIIPGIVFFGLLGALLSPSRLKKQESLFGVKQESVKDIFTRTAKVYLFVMALVFLGCGFKPVIDTFISKIPYRGLYWMNTISSVLDNATLASAEIGPSLHILQIKAALLGLLISGGMLIPGNIPNIIAAGKLKIKSSEWAKFGIPSGLVTMVVYYFLLK